MEIRDSIEIVMTRLLLESELHERPILEVNEAPKQEMCYDDVIAEIKDMKDNMESYRYDGDESQEFSMGFETAMNIVAAEMMDNLIKKIKRISGDA